MPIGVRPVPAETCEAYCISGLSPSIVIRAAIVSGTAESVVES